MPPPPPRRVGLRHRPPSHVVHGEDERDALCGQRRGERHRMHYVISSPRPQKPEVPGSGHERTREAGAHDRRPEARQLVRPASRAAHEKAEGGTFIFR